MRSGHRLLRRIKPFYAPRPSLEDWRWLPEVKSSVCPSRFACTERRLSTNSNALAASSKYDDGNDSSSSFGSNSEASDTGYSLIHDVGRGRFTNDDFWLGRRVIDHLNNQASISPAQLELSLKMFERLMAETATSRRADRQWKWLGAPWFHLPLLKHWRSLSQSHPGDVDSPKAMTKRLYELSSSFPSFKLTKTSVGIILDVLIQRSSKEHAPLAAAKLVDFLHLESRTNPSLQPDVVIYNQLIQAWAQSERPEAGKQMEEIVRTMLQKQISPSNVTYDTQLRFWSASGDVRKCEAILRRMELYGIPVDIGTLSRLADGYTDSGRLSECERFIVKMIKSVRDTGDGVGWLISSLQRFLTSQKDKVQVGAKERRESLQSIERIFNSFQECSHQLSEKGLDHIYHRFMDVLAVKGSNKLAEEVFERIAQPTEASYGILFKAYGNSDQADKALLRGKQILDDHSVEISNARVFNSVISAVASSSAKDALDQAFGFLRTIESNKRCRELRIKPDNHTYAPLFRCLHTKNPVDAGTKAQAILDEMKGRGVVPDSHTMTLAIRVCMRAKDYARADSIMAQMENSSSPPTLRTYNIILDYWSSLSSTAAAVRSEGILQHLKHMASSDPGLCPNVFTYNLVMKAWSLSGSAEASSKIWNLYEEILKRDERLLDDRIYNTMIGFYCRSGSISDVQLADDLILAMERKDGVQNRPQARHYNSVGSAWIKLNEIQRATRLMLRRTTEHIKNQNEEAKPTPSAIHGIVLTLVRKGQLRKATLFVEKLQALHDSGITSFRPSLDSLRLLRDSWKSSTDIERKIHLPKLAANIEKYSASS